MANSFNTETTMSDDKTFSWRDGMPTSRMSMRY